MSRANHAMRHDLKYLLRPEILSSAVSCYWPYPKDHTPSNFLPIAQILFGDKLDRVKLRQTCYPALKALSLLGPDIRNVPDLITFLPPPSSPEFVEQAVGLIIVLDQGPRALFEGTDGRWTNGFFDKLAYPLVRKVVDEHGAHEKHRWLSNGWSFEAWITLRFNFIAPLAHTESLDAQSLSVAIVEDSRAEVERATSSTDPYRKTRKEREHDTLAFSREVTKGLPDKRPFEIQDFMYWAGMIIDVHVPIIKEFGRYPYRNGAQGRVSTFAEERFLEQTGCFGCTDAETARKITEDVRAGRWTPLH